MLALVFARSPVPGDGGSAALFRAQLESLVARLAQVRGAGLELVAEAALGGGGEQPLVGEARGRVDLECEAREVADGLRTDADLAVGGDRDRKRIRTARADVADEDGGAAI